MAVVEEGRKSSAASIRTRICTSQPLSMSRIGSWERDTSTRPAKAIGRCSPGYLPSAICNASEYDSTGSYGAGPLRFMQRAGIAVLEAGPAQASKNDDLDARTRPACPVDDGDKIEKAVADRDVRVSRPEGVSPSAPHR